MSFVTKGCDRAKIREREEKVGRTFHDSVTDSDCDQATDDGPRPGRCRHFRACAVGLMLSLRLRKGVVARKQEAEML